MKPALLDTGVIVAALQRNEKRHDSCVRVLLEVAVPLITCEAVISESCYLLRGMPGAPEAVIANVEAGIFQLSFQLSSSPAEIKRILKRYEDWQIDLADACLIQMATEYDTGEILTLDSNFRIYRWGKNKPFHILPEDE